MAERLASKVTKLRVLLVTPSVGMGGAEMVQKLLAEQLLMRELDACVYAYEDDGLEDLFGHFPKDRLILNRNISLAELLCRERFDVVHAVTLCTNAGFLESVLKSRYGGGVVMTCHGAFLPAPTFSRADAYTAVSQAVAERIAKSVDVPIRTIYNGIDVSRFRREQVEKPEKPIVLWVGRTHDYMKDFSGFVALAMALRDDPVELWVASATNDERSLTIRDWLGERVRILEHVPPADMPGLYSRVAASGGCLVSTSYSEGLPMCILESMACGCPCVAPTVGGISEVIEHEQDGMLYNRKDGVDAAARLVRSLTSDVALQQTYSANAAKTIADKFTLDHMVDSYMRLYEEICSGRRASRPADVIFRTVASTALSLKRAVSGRKGGGV